MAKWKATQPEEDLGGVGWKTAIVVAVASWRLHT